MIALDTNVVVRLLTNDDPAQASRAVALFERESLWLPKTVLLETEWVLRSAYRLSRQAILKGFRSLLGYPSLEAEDRPAVLRALHWYGQGLDFADGLHLASLGPAERFATFDGTLVRKVRSIEGTPTVDPL